MARTSRTAPRPTIPLLTATVSGKGTRRGEECALELGIIFYTYGELMWWGTSSPWQGLVLWGPFYPNRGVCGADGSGISIPPCGSPGSPEERQATFSPGSVDSPNSSMENPLDTTGDITVEEVKDFLAYVVGGAALGAAGSSEGAQQSPGCIWFISPRSSEEVERNMRNASEDEVRPAGILIK